MKMDIFLQVMANGLLTGGFYMAVAVGITLIFGVLNVIYFAYGESIMLGSYLSYFLFTLWGIDPLASLPLAIILTSLLGAIVQRTMIKPVIKAPHLNQILLTFGIAVILQNLILITVGGDYVSLTTSYSGTSIKIGPLTIGLVRFLEFLLSIVLTGGITLWLRYTYWGRAVRAVTQNEESAKLMGINVDRVYFITFVLGSAMGGAAGVMISLIMYTFPLIGFNLVIKAFAIVILGGIGSIPGAVIGAMILGVTESLVSQYFKGGSGWAEGVSFMVIIAVLIVRPGGIFYAKEG